MIKISIKFGSTDDWVASDILKAADVIDTFADNKWRKAINTISTTKTIRGIIAHSDSAYSASVSDDIYVSTDSGANWAIANNDMDAGNYIRSCKADPTIGVSGESSATGQVVFTDDSGTNWTEVTASTLATAVYDYSFPTAALIVAFGNDAAGTDHIIFSDDSGASWTDATTQPDASCYCGDMFDGNTGYAITSGNKIYKTTNGAVNWTDTTHTSTDASTVMSMYAISATKAVIATTKGNIYLYDNAVGNAVLKIGNEETNLDVVSGVVQTTNGNVYAAFSSSTTGVPSRIYKSIDSGASWKALIITPVEGEAVDPIYKCGLSEIGTDNLLWVISRREVLRINDADN